MSLPSSAALRARASPMPRAAPDNQPVRYCKFPQYSGVSEFVRAGDYRNSPFERHQIEHAVSLIFVRIDWNRLGSAGSTGHDPAHAAHACYGSGDSGKLKE